ncbi:MAG TPA: GPW/gp25 family protein [Thermoleophilaceae bacterium]
MPTDFLGRGWRFPIGTDPTGSIALTDGPSRVEQSIRVILGTAFGERPMRPEFGCGAHNLVFAPADAQLAARVEHEVRASLIRWEPRIEVKRVTAALDDEEHSTLLVSIDYVIRHENHPRNLVFPFYTIGQEPE